MLEISVPVIVQVLRPLFHDSMTILAYSPYPFSYDSSYDARLWEKRNTGGKGAWKPVITCWVHLELMCIFPTM